MSSQNETTTMTEQTDIKNIKRDKTLKKLKLALEAGEFYHAHQIYRSVCNRYFTQANYGKAISMLYEGAMELLKYDQYASASDLGVYLIKAYTASETKVDSTSFGRIMDILRKFPSSEKTRSSIIVSALDWNTKFSKLRSGEPLFHDALASMYENEGNFLLAENHYIFGTDDTSETFAGMLFRWAASVEPLNFGFFFTRSILSLIVTGNASKATRTGKAFVIEVAQHRPELVSANDKSDAVPEFIEFKEPLLNFVQLLLLLLPKAGARNLYAQLRNRYQPQLVNPIFNFSEYLDRIGEQYFGIRIQRPVNILQSLMSNMFNPGNGSSQGAPSLSFDQIGDSSAELD